ncbi:hypothetical protein KCP69_18325 [Salmonella enterica subsp. enterica]|nr:hypothetical protein KCP69_18325 [Salmonella enterica subsp. enterica]
MYRACQRRWQKRRWTKTGREMGSAVSVVLSSHWRRKCRRICQRTLKSYPAVYRKVILRHECNRIGAPSSSGS